MDDCPFESDDFDLQDLYLDELAAEISLSPQKVAAEISPQKESSSSSVPPQLLEGDDWESDIYNQCIQASLTKLENLTPRSSFKRDDLLKIDSTGKHKRLRIGKRNLVHYEIFPWFHYGLIVHNCDRFRESCDDNFIEKIIDAMNYFWSRRYSAQNLRQLQQIYTSLQGDRNDTNRYCTRIIDAYRNFRNLAEERPSSPFSFGFSLSK